MEKRDCGIVRDLMPLVIDRVASPASTELVESHIRECEECREVMAQMRAEPAVKPAETDTGFIRFCKKLEREFRWRRVVVGALAALLVCAILCGGIFFTYYKMNMWDEPYSPKLSDCKVEFREEDDGFLRVTVPRPVGYRFMGWGGEGGKNSGVIYIDPQRSQWRTLFGNRENGSETCVIPWIRLIDGQICYHEAENEVKYDSYTGCYVDSYTVTDTPIRELYLGSEKVNLDDLIG